MQALTDVQIVGAARLTGLIGPGADNVSVSSLRAFLKALGIPIENRGPFEKPPVAHLNLNPAGVGAGATVGGK